MNDRLIIIGHGIPYGIFVQYQDAAFRRSGAYDFHPGETAFEILNLLLHLAYAGTAFFNLLDVFLVKHSVTWFDIKFLSVVVLAAQRLKTGRVAAEEKIVRENGVIVLQDGGDFSLCLSAQIYLYRL